MSINSSMSRAFTLLEYFIKSTHDETLPPLEEVQIIRSNVLFKSSFDMFSDPVGYKKRQEEEAQLTRDRYLNWLEMVQGQKSIAQFNIDCEKLSRRAGHYDGLSISNLKDIPELAEDVEAVRNHPQTRHLGI